jgi:hypothetical protein
MGRIQGDLLERTLDFGVDILGVLKLFPNDARG